jgi:hypothetical protein
MPNSFLVVAPKAARPKWLSRFAIERLLYLMNVKNYLPRNDFYPKIFYLTAYAVPLGVD